MLSYIELFQGRLHDFIEEGMKRGSKYLPMIQNVFRAEGLPLDLAYVPLVESAFKPNALSRAKAKGVWQFMGGTALENGLRRDWYIDERSDPEKATVAAAKYLKTLGKHVRAATGTWRWRPTTAARAACSAPSSGPASTISGRSPTKPKLLPRETREYVPMILAAIVIARNPAQYGFEFEPEAAGRVRQGHAVPAGRSAPRRRVGRHDDRRDSGAQSRAAALDDAGPRRAVRAEGAGRHGRRSSARGWPTRRRVELASLKWYTVKRGETLATDRQEAAASAGPISPRPTTCSANGARGRRPEADGAARGDGADGGRGPSAPVPVAESRPDRDARRAGSAQRWRADVRTASR